MRGLLIVIAVLVAACGRIAFDPLTGGGDDTQPGGDAQGSGDPDGGGSATGDGGIDATTQISPNCGTNVLISDDFANGTLDPAWTMVASAGYQVAEANGRAGIQFPATANANTRAGYRQAATISFSGICAIGELVTTPNATTTGYAYVRVGTPTLNLEITVQSGNLGGKFNTGAQSGTIGGSTPWNPVNHRFVRIRNTGGTNYAFEAGPSLTSFTTSLGSQGGMLFQNLSPNSVEIGAATQGAAVTAGGNVAFESFILLAP